MIISPARFEDQLHKIFEIPENEEKIKAVNEEVYDLMLRTLDSMGYKVTEIIIHDS